MFGIVNFFERKVNERYPLILESDILMYDVDGNLIKEVYNKPFKRVSIDKEEVVYLAYKVANKMGYKEYFKVNLLPDPSDYTVRRNVRQALEMGYHNLDYGVCYHDFCNEIYLNPLIFHHNIAEKVIEHELVHLITKASNDDSEFINYLRESDLNIVYEANASYSFKQVFS